MRMLSDAVSGGDDGEAQIGNLRKLGEKKGGRREYRDRDQIRSRLEIEKRGEEIGKSWEEEEELLGRKKVLIHFIDSLFSLCTFTIHTTSLHVLKCKIVEIIE